MYVYNVLATCLAYCAGLDSSDLHSVACFLVMYVIWDGAHTHTI